MGAPASTTINYDSFGVHFSDQFAGLVFRPTVSSAIFPFLPQNSTYFQSIGNLANLTSAKLFSLPIGAFALLNTFSTSATTLRTELNIFGDNLCYHNISTYTNDRFYTCTCVINNIPNILRSIIRNCDGSRWVVDASGALQ